MYVDRKYMASTLGVSVEYFRKKVETREDFPKPVLRLSREMVKWSEKDFDRWLSRQHALAKA